MRLLLIAALASILIPGCVSRSRTATTAATLAGVATTVVGIGMLATVEPPPDRSDDGETHVIQELASAWACDSCRYIAPVAVITAGLILGLSGAAGLAQLDKSSDVVVVTTAPAAPKAIDSRLLAPLPELATDDRTLQMAKQVRGAARRGDCEAAGVTLEHIRERDPRYARALAGSAALAPCSR